MMNDESNYYRDILEIIWGYDKELLDTMTDEDCETEYQAVAMQWL